MDLKNIRNSLIVGLAQKACSVREIQRLLQYYINVNLSVRQIQRILKHNNLNKRPREESSLHSIALVILEELKGPGSLLGYRAMCNRLRNQHQLTVKRSTVMALLASLDPEGTAQRKIRRLKRRIYRNKGPNFLWHCDGYDKLKPYGLPIHGCIDGYSRKILWLNVSKSNNDPSQVAWYYMNAVQQLSGCPRFLRTDLGTENSTIAFLQPLMQHQLNISGHIYGRSTMNQRIESFWSLLRKQYSEWWINFFKEITMQGCFNTSYNYHIDTARYALAPLIQKQLDTFKSEWNLHYVRKPSMAEAPGGIPNVLYDFPQLKGVDNYACSIPDQTIRSLKDQFTTVPSIVNENYKNLADALVRQYHLPEPLNLTNALELFFSLLELFEQIM
ncbi:PREDICTED: uncharacterized protein LOC109587312 [Amphimedon queenslandica]|uniref:Integrase catalytic domain-containing protein n=2 Tax=Amphimedon queenslandica TaxID=400682 RepID=A0AAN0JQL5_AMPQE|nr:PREDICTED: uncharacterized protein LOC109587312 [Amphimedon queenslandica]|eukprot:XP_019859117.1 PREDICTED: uncharacterized protein LOC109587312 [Amphimedon queenslandica]